MRSTVNDASRSAAEVAPERDQRRVLVVKLHAQRSVHRLRDFGNRGRRLVADLVGVDGSPSSPFSVRVTSSLRQLRTLRMSEKPDASSYSAMLAKPFRLFSGFKPTIVSRFCVRGLPFPSRHGN